MKRPNESKSDQSELEFIASVRADLNRSAAALDENTLKALSHARRHALSHRRRPRTYWKFAGGMALAGLAALAVVRVYQPAPTTAQPATGMDDMELLSSNEELDLYQDFEFYYWLAANEHADS